MRKSMWLLAGTVAMVLGAAATAALAGDGKQAGRKAGGHERAKTAAQERRRRLAEFVASLNATDEQRALVLEKARAAAPIAAAARDEARRIVARAWAAAAKDGTADRKAVRASVKGEIQALRERTRAQVEPLAREVVASLTPEQRQKFEAAASRRGRPMDDAKLTRIAARLISRPITVSYLEARTAK